MKMIQIVAVIFLVMCLYCSRDFGSQPAHASFDDLTAAEANVLESSDRFGFALFQKLAETESEKNLFLSPLSVSMAMAMAYNGAENQTAAELKNTLGYEGFSQKELNQAYKLLAEKLLDSDPLVRFEIANSIWYRQDFKVKEAFLNLNRTYFDAMVKALDFGSSDALPTINGWVENKTHGKIAKIIDRIDPFAVMFLINAIYFKGDWTYAFNEENTRDDTFFAPDQEYPCKMMKQKNEFRYGENEKVQLVELPYGNGQFAMTVVLPNPEYDLSGIVAGLTLDTLQSWSNSMSEQSGTVLLPQFKIEYEKDLNDVLQALGIEDAFKADRADFSAISDANDLYIDKVKHKSYVRVDEQGTEAAAVTSVEFRVTSVPAEKEFYIKSDRPFLFFIQAKSTGSLLFMGTVYVPESDESSGE
ncbi:serpin family protein [candidate division KSB1 bacterium]|nr:serpin family protein [candidate division KSB1 bacterium]